MFDRCITCERLGQDCAPNLLSLSFQDLLSWWKKRQAFLQWSNQVLSEKSTIPVGTINRIKAGEDDARYSTMRCIIHALMGGHSAEFPCQKKLDQEFAHFESLEKQCEALAGENEALITKMQAIEEAHQNDAAHLNNALKDLDHALANNKEYKALLENIHASHKEEMEIVRADDKKKIDYLLNLVEKLRSDNDNLWKENNRKSKLVDMLLENR
jgi:hypothetical protein